MEEIFNEPCDAYYRIFSDTKDSGYKYRFLSPFEFKNVLISYAEKSVGKNKVLNAGRGNPNFFSTLPRHAFALLTTISTSLGENLCQEYDDIGFMPEKKGISKAFNKLLLKEKSKPEGKFLKKAIEHMIKLSNIPKDDFIHDIVISTIGCFYPSPPRVQNFAEPILSRFLEQSVYQSNKNLDGKIDIFPTEGASAAIIYVFNSLKYNGLVIPGDQIGILTPIFSPYLEFPTLQNYNLEQVCIKASETDWEITDEEIEKIKSTRMRALFLVNPTNPTSLSLSKITIQKIAAVVNEFNPNLIIIADNVYAPFVDEFNSFFNVLPKNTIGIYSFSKYFGVTGWRLGSIAMHKNNVIDLMLKEAPKTVHERYSMISINPEKIKFIDRLSMDSRQVAESHTSGLSTPQQVLMTLFAMYDLMEYGTEYKKDLKEILRERMTNLITPIEYKIDESNLNSNYYLIIDICKAAVSLTGNTEFADYLYNTRDPLEFLIKLAKEYGTVLLSAVGFAGPFWGVRVSLANLDTDKYEQIGENIKSLIFDYYEKDFDRWKTKQLKTSSKK